jgi:hypothetical protein
VGDRHPLTLSARKLLGALPTTLAR